MKLGFYVVRKRYKGKVYEHELVCLRFPKELHEILRCLRDHQLVIKATKEGTSIRIDLIDRKNQANKGKPMD